VELDEIKKQYPEISTIIGDARKMHIDNKSFDIVYSNATIEHVGDFENQIKFVSECCRVSKKYVFIQTPNRFYPIEIHTKLPFIHFLPEKIYRKVLKFIGFSFYADINNLNLLSKKKMLYITDKLNIRSFKLIEHKFLGFVSNLILIIKL
jgi:ubiquinone/menaquinone biosynthesis C-methylase UbiE